MDSTTKKHRQFRPLPVPSVTVGGLFGERQDAICESTASTLLDRCIQAGMLKQIDPDQPAPGVIIAPSSMSPTMPATEHRSMVSTQMFWDSDFGKSIEAIAYSLYRRPNPELEARADAIIDRYEKLQREDGYLNSWYLRIEPGREWTNLRDTHELYCAGHLIEGAVAYFQATGKRKLLDVMCRYVDRMIQVFGHGESKIPGYCGHEQIELALVKLARATSERKYMDLARFFIDERGTQPHYFDIEARRDGRDPKNFIFGSYEYNQSHLPVREQTKVVGHAVRAMYLYSGMADIATEYNDDSLTAALDTLWDDLTTKQMYITGSIGPSADNEGFTEYYDLPNESAYAETCASVGLVFWASRMLGRGPNRRYADIMEQTLYNGAMAGMGLDGTSFFYENPLKSAGNHHRWTWHRCPCCPPNITRLLASVGSYMYATSSDEIAVHLYGESRVTAEVAGSAVTLVQETRYPWNGAIRINVGLKRRAFFTISLRMPGWAELGTSLSVNGETVNIAAVSENGYARIEREWQDGDRIDLDLPLTLRQIYANPKVRHNLGRVAFMRGPLVYCVEEADNEGDLDAIVIPAEMSEGKDVVVDALNGAVAVDLSVVREDASGWDDVLYRTKRAEKRPAMARIVPYHLWGNRSPGSMLVWLRTEQ